MKILNKIVAIKINSEGCMIIGNPVLYLFEILERIEDIIFKNCMEFMFKACY
jgi:hypothetical protein